jgi:hypothetical protein
MLARNKKIAPQVLNSNSKSPQISKNNYVVEWGIEFELISRSVL